MHGQPVWDDTSYLFKYNVIVTDYPYSTIWKDFGWPISVSLHKLLFSYWHFEYFNFHLLNFTFHFLNSVLILNIAEKMKFPFARLLFVFFFLHPANVISVSWMIQLKTLLCLFFALLSFQFLMRTEINKKWIGPSWLFFAFSLLSKSSSIALPIFFFLFLKKKLAGKKLLWLLPFLLLSLTSGWRILTSPVTTAAVESIESKPAQVTQKNFNPIAAEGSSNTKTDQDHKPRPEKTELQEVYLSIEDEEIGQWEMFTTRYENFISMSHYYFWQTLLPIENAPVKGLKYEGIGLIEYIHIIFIILIIVINWGTSIARYLLTGHLLLLPFLGLFPAPYMNLTWVSDQHLYLALPFFICFWLSLLTRWKMKYAPMLPAFLIPIYIFKVLSTTPFYTNEIDFYSASLKTNALNVPIAYNLSIAYLRAGDMNQAMNVTSTMMSMSRVAPEVLNNRYFSYIYLLDLNLHKTPTGKKTNEN